MAGEQPTAFDIIIIGSGPAGYVGAIHAAQLGLSVACIEKEPGPTYGGTCVLRGCIPTKALLETAHLLDKMRHAEAFGLRAEGIELDFPAAQAYKAKVVKSNTSGVAYLFKKYGVTGIQGWGTLAGGLNVDVKGADGKTRTIEARRGIVLATGSACKHLPFIEMDHKRTIDSDDILELEEVPKRLVVLGAGAVGVEFASIFKRFGTDVTIVEIMDRLVPLEDEDVSAALFKSFRRQGIRSLISTKVDAVKRTDEGVSLQVVLPDGNKETIETDLLLVATGRRPFTEGLGLEKTTIKLDQRGFIPVDGYMRTTESGIYAVGDVVPTAMLAHLGNHEAMLAVAHIAGKDPHPINYERVPSGTYCDPEIASVGLTEAEAKKRGYDVKVSTFPFTANGKAKIQVETEGFVKFVGEKKYDELLGVHIIGPKATELIAEAVVALNLEATAAEMAMSIHPHPTLSEAMGEVGHGLFYGSTLHI